MRWRQHVCQDCRVHQCAMRQTLLHGCASRAVIFGASGLSIVCMALHLCSCATYARSWMSIGSSVYVTCESAYTVVSDGKQVDVTFRAHETQRTAPGGDRAADRRRLARDRGCTRARDADPPQRRLRPGTARHATAADPHHRATRSGAAEAHLRPAHLRPALPLDPRASRAQAQRTKKKSSSMPRSSPALARCPRRAVHVARRGRRCTCQRMSYY